jgi:hypothetical protein
VADFLLLLFGGSFLVSIFVSLITKVRDSPANARLRVALEEQFRANDAQYRSRLEALETQRREVESIGKERLRRLETDTANLKLREEAFSRSFCDGRQWLARFIAEAQAAVDDARETSLIEKARPALKAADVVAQVRAEKRDLTTRLKFTEYQLRSYEEWFPFLVEYRQVLLDEQIPLVSGKSNLRAVEDADPVLPFLSKDEYAHLPPTERNQRALERYLNRRKSDWEIGRHYERYLGYLRESAGWNVDYHGAIEGFEDLGRDLICAKDGIIEIIQAKCWSKSKVIHEKHLFQLFGTTIHYRLAHPFNVVNPVFVTTTELSAVAIEIARSLGVVVQRVDLAPFPMVKCNINATTKERIYHLPFDQQYDRTQIRLPGEFFAWNVAEAETQGFRRAWRHRLGGSDALV